MDFEKMLLSFLVVQKCEAGFNKNLHGKVLTHLMVSPLASTALS